MCLRLPRFRDNPEINVTSLDYDMIAKYRLDDRPPYDGKLDLVKSVIRRLNRRNSGQRQSVQIKSVLRGWEGHLLQREMLHVSDP